MARMPSDAGSPSWSIEGRDWPNRDSSRFVASGGLTWHLQEIGSGPGLLLLHGTGAATHSFRDLAPKLAEHFHVLAPDLPAHGFTQMPRGDGLSLDGMARLVDGLLKQSEFEPEIVVGHSAGAAILIAMTLGGLIRPKIIVAINGALRPIKGAALFSPLAKLLFLNPLMPKLFAWRADSSDATRRLLEGTGSRIDARGVELYARLFRKSGHVAGTLGMMANWDLDRLERRIATLQVPLVLVSAINDKAVPPHDAKTVAARASSATAISLDYGGHLVHEEFPDRIAVLICDQARQAGVVSSVDTVVTGQR